MDTILDMTNVFLSSICFCLFPIDVACDNIFFCCSCWVTTLEVTNTETVMAGNEDIDTPPPQDISNVFAAADLSSQSSYDTDKYKRSWHRTKGIRSSVLSSGESPDAQSRALSIALNHR